MITFSRSVLNFAINNAPVIALFGASANLAMVIATLATQQFALMVTCSVNVCLFTLIAYLAHRYMVLHTNITPVDAHEPLTPVTMNNYNVRSEREIMPDSQPSQLSSSMLIPGLQQIAQTGPTNNPAEVEVTEKP